MIVFGGHLRKDAVPEPQRGEAEALQPAAVHEFVVHHGSGHDDFGTPRSDAFDFAALGDRKARQSLGDAAHLGARDCGPSAARAIFSEMSGRGSESGGSPRGRDDVLDPGGHDARSDAPDFPRDKPAQPLQFALSRWIMAEKLVGQADRSQRQADRIVNLAASGDSELTAAPTEINHQRGRTVDASAGH